MFIHDEPSSVLEPSIDVKVTIPRRSTRNRKQTQLFGNPLLYRITCQYTPRTFPEMLQHLSETMEVLKENYSGTVEF